MAGLRANLRSRLLSPLSPQVKIWFQNRRMKWRNSMNAKARSAEAAASRPFPPNSTRTRTSATWARRVLGTMTRGGRGPGQPPPLPGLSRGPRRPLGTCGTRAGSAVAPSPARSGSPDKASTSPTPRTTRRARRRSRCSLEAPRVPRGTDYQL